MAKRLVIDEEVCVGCGHCTALCPEVFAMDGEHSQVVGQDRCGSCNCQEAVDTCPVQAIRWEEAG